MFNFKLIAFDFDHSISMPPTLAELAEWALRGATAAADDYRMAGLPVPKKRIERAIREGTIKEMLPALPELGRSTSQKIETNEEKIKVDAQAIEKIISEEGDVMGEIRKGALLLWCRNFARLGITDPNDIRLVISILSPNNDSTAWEWGEVTASKPEFIARFSLSSGRTLIFRRNYSVRPSPSETLHIVVDGHEHLIHGGQQNDHEYVRAKD